MTDPPRLRAALGIALADGAIIPILPRDTRLPIETTVPLSTAADDQLRLEVTLVLGDGQNPWDSRTIGTFSIGGLPSGPRGVPTVNLVVSIDAHHALTLTVSDAASGVSQVVGQADLAGATPDSPPPTA